MLLSLYLHFPFCVRKCAYCDFVSGRYSPEEMHRYCDLLIRELRREGETWRDAGVNTVFFGGGTPSLVPPEEMSRVLKALGESFHLLPGAEFTSEANPGTLRGDWLEVMLSGGLNRLSLGIQASQDFLLKRLGRIHSFSQAEEGVKLARSLGIANLNGDVMFALPGQSRQDYLETLEQVAGLGLPHVSAYSLILEEGTPLAEQVSRGEAMLPGEDEAAEQYEAGLEKLRSLGYERYEISNFALPGYECRHNLGYWQGAWYLGLGLAAHSFLPTLGEGFALRRANPSTLAAYEEMVERGGAGRENQRISREDAMFECVMLGLRTRYGVSAGEFLTRYGTSLEERFPGAADSLCRDGLAVWQGDRLALTDRGMLVENTVLMRFME